MPGNYFFDKQVFQSSEQQNIGEIRLMSSLWDFQGMNVHVLYIK